MRSRVSYEVSSRNLVVTSRNHGLDYYILWDLESWWGLESQPRSRVATLWSRVMTLWSRVETFVSSCRPLSPYDFESRPYGLESRSVGLELWRFKDLMISSRDLMVSSRDWWSRVVIWWSRSFLSTAVNCDNITENSKSKGLWDIISCFKMI